MSKINFVPMQGAILIDLPKIEEKTSAGIIKSPDMIEKEQKKADNFFSVVAIPEDIVIIDY